MSTILAAMNDMADAMTAVNASRRQVRGVAAWRDLVAAAVTAGQAAGVPHAGQLAVPAAGSRTHGRWMATADAIIATLDGHAAEARMMADQARQQAAEARDQEKRFRAHQADCEQLGLYQRAALYADMAAVAAKEAGHAEQHAFGCEDWAAAAADASARGAALTVREDAIHQPVGQAVAGAGGRAWIADDKTFITMTGGA